MERFKIKISQYQWALPASSFSFLWVFLYFTLSHSQPSTFPQFPSEVFGINFSFLYIHLNILAFFSYVFPTLLICFSPNIEKYMKKGSDKYPFGNLDRLVGLSICGIGITIWNAITEWNIIVMLQTATFFIHGCIMIMWLIIDARMNHISLRMIFKEKPLIKPDPWELNKNHPAFRRGGG